MNNNDDEFTQLFTSSNVQTIVETLQALRQQSRTESGRVEALQSHADVFASLSKLLIAHSDNHDITTNGLACSANLIADDVSGGRRRGSLDGGLLATVVRLLASDNEKIGMVSLIVISNFVNQCSDHEELGINLVTELVCNDGNALFARLVDVVSSSVYSVGYKLMAIRTIKSLMDFHFARVLFFSSQHQFARPMLRAVAQTTCGRTGSEGKPQTEQTQSPSEEQPLVLSAQEVKLLDEAFGLVSVCCLQDCPEEDADALQQPSPTSDSATVCRPFNATSEEGGFEVVTDVYAEYHERADLPSVNHRILGLLKDLLLRSPERVRLVNAQRAFAVATAQARQQPHGRPQSAVTPESMGIPDLERAAKEDLERRGQFIASLPGVLSFLVGFLRDLDSQSPTELHKSAVELLASLCQHDAKFAAAFWEQRQYTHIVACIAKSSDNIEAMLDAEGDLDRVKVMSNAVVRLNCFECLNHLALTVERCAALLSETDIVPQCTRLLNRMVTFDYEVVRKVVVLIKNLMLEPVNRSKFVGSNIGKALIKVFPSRDYHSAVIAAACIRIVLNTYDEEILMEMLNPLSIRMLLSLDLKTTHPHLRAEAARILGFALCIAGERVLVDTQQAEPRGVKCSAKLCDANVDNTRIFELYEELNTIPVVEFVAFLLASQQQRLINEAVQALLRCKSEIFQHLKTAKIAGASSATIHDRLVEVVQVFPDVAEDAQRVLGQED